tara:strand:+ start:114 stop:272 length:159 start_codon:yes stop_codon:yes gene_type:complete
LLEDFGSSLDFFDGFSADLSSMLDFLDDFGSSAFFFGVVLDPVLLLASSIIP